MTECLKIQSPASRTYLRRQATSMLFYVVTLLITIRTLRHFHPSYSVAVLLALLPALPIIACIVSVALYLRDETDEFQRSIMTQMLLWAIACTLTATSIWGFLEMYASAPPLPAFWIFVLYSIFVALVALPIQARYRTGASE